MGGLDVVGLSRILDIVGLSRIKKELPRITLPPMPARVGPDCGEAVDE
jgi:hypothetical protein